MSSTHSTTRDAQSAIRDTVRDSMKDAKEAARESGKAGVYFFLSDLAAKQLGLLRELTPSATRIGLLVNPNNANAEAVTREMAAAVSAMGVQMEVVRASDTAAIDAAFAALVRNKTDALVVGSDPFFFTRRVQFATLAARHAIPADL